MENILEMDEKVRLAHEKLVELNTQYNELLDEIRTTGDKKKISPEEEKLVKKRGVIELVYWIILSVLLFLLMGGILNSNSYLLVFIAHVALNMGARVKINKDISKLHIHKKEKIYDRDTLYEELCNAREYYHSLVKKRDHMVLNEEIVEANNIIEEVFGEENIKKLEYKVNK